MMIFGEPLRVIRQRTVLAAERKIEARRGWKRGQLERRRNLKGGIELGWPGQFRRKPPGERSKQAGREKAEVERSALHLSSTRAITSKSTRVIGNWQSALANLFSRQADTRHRWRRTHRGASCRTVTRTRLRRRDP